MSAQGRRAPGGGTDRASLIADVPTDCTCPAGTYNPGNVHEPYCDLSHPDSGITARTHDEWLERLHEGARQIQRYNRRDARAT